jgi:ubiquinone/menaquinone biosynthesis C-methylase UbiE
MTTERFDAQAVTFDDRAGIPSQAAQEVARSILDLVLPEPDDLFIELGAGTGEIGAQLARSINYLGLDGSGPMLDAFRSRLSQWPSGRARLVKADANSAWPVEHGSAAVVFASRVAHLLNPDHLSSELARVCRPGGYFLVGHVSRDQRSLRRVLRDRRAALLQDRGLTPRSGRAATRRLLDGLIASGASDVGTRPVAAWAAHASARQVLDEWSRLDSMGGISLDADVRAAVLDELAEWVGRELGDPDTVTAWQERYMLGGVRLKEERSTTRC